MKVGILTKILREKPFDEALKQISSVGYGAITLGSGGLSNNPEDHCNAELLVNDDKAFTTFMDTIRKYNLEVTCIANPSNPVHPQKHIAQKLDKELRDCILLAEKMGVDRISTFSGCPGDHENAMYPNWVSYAWPYDFTHVLKWQWEEVLIPYWLDLVQFAREHHVYKIGMEFHPGFCVYNPKSLLKLRDAVGPEIGVCLDISHLLWMGMDPVTVIEKLKDCVWQVHGKDVTFRPGAVAENGVIETGGFGDLMDRSWYFSVPGYGHDLAFWKKIVHALQMIGYDKDICFEHEDALLGRDEGIVKAYEFLSQAILTEPAAGCNWTADVKKAKFGYLNL